MAPAGSLPYRTSTISSAADPEGPTASQQDCKPSSIRNPDGRANDSNHTYSAALSANTHPKNYDRLVANYLKHVPTTLGRNACWPWVGCVQSKGYGVIGYLCADGVMRRFLAHRVGWMLATGQSMLPDIQVMHSCDNPRCVNPRHLFPGSQSDNMQDAIRKGRAYIGALNPNSLARRAAKAQEAAI